MSRTFSSRLAGSCLPVLSLLIAFFFVGCDSSDDDEAPGTVTVQMTHTVGNEVLVFNDQRFTNAAGNNYSVTLLEYIITDVALRTAGGSSVSISDVEYVNAEDAATQSFSMANVPGDTYTGITFTFGIDGPENTTGALPSTAEFNNMAWPAQMGGGYHYMRLEGFYAGATGQVGFPVHTGPTMGNDFSIDVALPGTIVVDGGETEVELVMDINEWFANPDIYDFRDFQGMIMGNATAQALLQANGADVFSFGNVQRN